MPRADLDASAPVRAEHAPCPHVQDDAGDDEDEPEERDAAVKGEATGRLLEHGRAGHDRRDEDERHRPRRAPPAADHRAEARARDALTPHVPQRIHGERAPARDENGIGGGGTQHGRVAMLAPRPAPSQTRLRGGDRSATDRAWQC
jgi:hypothetical protein